MLSHVLAAVGFWFSGRVIRRLSALNTLVAGQVLNRFGSIVAYAFPTVFSPIILPITSLFWSMGFVAQRTLLQEQFSDAQRTTMGSLNSFFGNLVYSAFAIGFGAFADRIGPAMSLLIGELLLLPVIAIYYSVFRYQAQCEGRVETC